MNELYNRETVIYKLEYVRDTAEDNGLHEISQTLNNMIDRVNDNQDLTENDLQALSDYINTFDGLGLYGNGDYLFEVINAFINE